MSEQEISKATIGRMPLYLHFLQEESSKGAKYISSAVIAQNIPVSERSGDRIGAAGASAFRVRGREADCGYREIFGV